ncbi:MAG: ABC transporter substrate-binding protein [Anaerolineae bacterium]|nr:ABC transporter substrate-binding protein [Anaerolineae bacterium]
MPRSTPPIIKIGMIAPFEGLYRPEGYAALYAVKLALRECNATGGVAGYRVELVALNDDGDPAQAALQARKLALDPDVMGIIGPFSRATTAAAGPPLAEAGLAWIAPASAPDAVIEAYPNAFRLFASDRALATALLEWVARQMGEGEGIWIPEIGDFAPPLLEAARRISNWDVWTSAALEDLPQPEPEVVALGGDAEQVADFLSPLTVKLDQSFLVGGPEAAGMVVMQRMGPAMPRLIWVTSLQNNTWPESFALGYQELAGSPPTPEAALTYDATRVLLDAIAYAAATVGLKKSSRLTRADVITALGATRWDGLNGLILFDIHGSWISAPLQLYQANHGQRFGPVQLFDR